MPARIVFIFAYLIASLISSGSFATTVKDLSNDSEVSIGRGDFFKAYRSLIVLEKKKPQHFSHMGVDHYLQSLFIIGEEEFIQDECDRFVKSGDAVLSPKAAYLCGLYFLERKDSVLSATYLRNVPGKSNLHWPALILEATGDLLRNDPAQAINRLSLNDLKIFAKFGLEDRFYLCRARAYTIQNKFEEAIKEFQAISSTSPFYAEALNETAWVFFKMRRFESAHVLLDVMIGNYETKHHTGLDLKITPTVYYRARYLRAYLALIEQRSEEAVNEFLDLKNDYEKFLAKNKALMDAGTVLQTIKETNQDWSEVRYIPAGIVKQLDLIGEWIGPEVRENFKLDILLQMALTREIQRIRRLKDLNSDVASYLNNLDRLKATSWGLFANRYSRFMKKTEQNMRTLALKAEVGRLEVIWLGRAQGARNLDDVIDSYGQSVRAIDDFIEPGVN